MVGGILMNQERRKTGEERKGTTGRVRRGHLSKDKRRNERGRSVQRRGGRQVGMGRVKRRKSELGKDRKI